MQTDAQVCVRCYDPEQMQGKTFILALMCVWNRSAPCHTHFVILWSWQVDALCLLFPTLKQLFSVTLAEEVNTLVLFSSDIYSEPTSKYSTNWNTFWSTYNNWICPNKSLCNEMTTSTQPIKSDIFIHSTKVHVCHVVPVLSSFLPLILPRLSTTPPAFYCTEGKTQTLSTLSFGKCKELPDSGFPQRHTQEALLKPRLNPTLLCPRFHATIHFEDSLIQWRGCCTLTPQGHSGHSIGRYSNPGSVTESQGETLYCFLLWNPCRAAGEIQS